MCACRSISPLCRHPDRPESRGGTPAHGAPVIPETELAPTVIAPDAMRRGDDDRPGPANQPERRPDVNSTK